MPTKLNSRGIPCKEFTLNERIVCKSFFKVLKYNIYIRNLYYKVLLFANLCLKATGISKKMFDQTVAFVLNLNTNQRTRVYCKVDRSMTKRSTESGSTIHAKSFLDCIFKGTNCLFFAFAK